jgi:hypothetical protein
MDTDDIPEDLLFTDLQAGHENAMIGELVHRAWSLRKSSLGSTPPSQLAVVRDSVVSVLLPGLAAAWYPIGPPPKRVMPTVNGNPIYAAGLVRSGARFLDGSLVMLAFLCLAPQEQPVAFEGLKVYVSRLARIPNLIEECLRQPDPADLKRQLLRMEWAAQHLSRAT